MGDKHYIENVFKHLHQHPELSLYEEKTAAFLAEELGRLGFIVTTGVGGTGVVGILEGSLHGPTLALRSDMDALPVQEETGVDFSSLKSDVMHACGHDSHMAITLGACAFAAKQRSFLQGSLMVIFQPAEEIVAGAKAMLEDDLFGGKIPTRLVGIHNWPKIPAGILGLQKGSLTAFSDRFQVVFHGQGGHGAFPHTTKDPIAMATAGIQAAFSLVQRGTDALKPQVLSFGVIQGGSSFNVIPESVRVEGTVRTLHLKDQELAISLLHQAFGSAASLYGGSYSLDYQRGVPAVVNHGEVVDEILGFFHQDLPETEVKTSGLASLIGEDIAYFLQEVPGVLLYVGSGEVGAINELHNPGFIVPLKALFTGYDALKSIISGYLGLEGGRSGEK